MWVLGLLVLHRMRLDARLFGSVRGAIAENHGLLPFITTTNIDITLRELAPRLIPLLIGWMLTPIATGVFSLAQRASTVLEQPALLLGQASYAVMAKLVAARDTTRLSRLAWQSAGTALLLSVPVLVLLAFFSTPLLGLIGGKSFRGGATLLLLLAFARAIAISAPPFTSALIAMGLPLRTIMVNLLANVLLLPLLPLFLLLFGLNGAGWHVILQSSVTAIALAAWFRVSLRRISDEQPARR